MITKNNEKINWKSKLEELQKRYNKMSEDYKVVVKEKNEREIVKLRPPKHEDKICPFMSTPYHLAACNSRCMLHRNGKAKNYECPLIELTSISWTLRGKYTNPQKRNDYNYKKK